MKTLIIINVSLFILLTILDVIEHFINKKAKKKYEEEKKKEGIRND